MPLSNKLLPDYDNKLFGDNLAHYTFFEDLSATSSTKLRLVFYNLKIPYRSWNALRHTRATYLIGETGDFLLTRLWLGHRKQEVLEKYIHVYQSVVRNAKKKDSSSKKLSPLKA